MKKLMPHLTEAFNKFDESGDNELGSWEFQQAWFYLGLKGTEAEIQDAFKDVDTNNSGLIDNAEFLKAIKGERMMELSLTRVLNKMGVQYADAQSQYEAFKKTSARRRLMKKQYEADVAKYTKEIISKLSGLSDTHIPKKNADDEKT